MASLRSIRGRTTRRNAWRIFVVRGRFFARRADRDAVVAVGVGVVGQALPPRQGLDIAHPPAIIPAIAGCQLGCGPTQRNPQPFRDSYGSCNW